MAQFARPISDITTTEIVGSYTAIDEVTSDTADYLTSNDNTDATYECLLSPLTDPLTDTFHYVRFTYAKADTNVAPSTTGNTQTMSIYLYQGATLIATCRNNATLGAWTTGSYWLTGAEADAITDYSDLRIRFVMPASGGGSPSNRRGGAVAWAEMEVPDAPVGGARRRIIIT